MNSKQLKRLLNLVKKTGDRLIVADKDSDDVFVLLNLEDYEDLSQVGEADYDDIDFHSMPETDGIYPVRENDEEILGRINHDIAEWQDEKKRSVANEINVANEISEEMEEAEDPSAHGHEDSDSGAPAKGKPFTKGVRPMPSLGDVLADDKYRKREFDETPRKNWVEEDDLSDVPGEEEKFYLEPVE